MNNDNNHHIDEALFAKFFAGEATAIEVAQIENWASQSEDNQLEFERLAMVWKDLGALNDAPAVEVDTDKAWEKLNSRIEAETTSPKRSLAKVWRVAAAVVLLLGGAWLAQSLLSPAQLEIAAANTPIEQTLPDGSSVALNAHAVLTYPEGFDRDARRVALEGEAFFEVVRDTTQPFVVDAGAVSITVLGTSFNVNATKDCDSTVVYVATGKVAVTHRENEIILTPGMTGVYYKQTGALNIVETANRNDQFWRTKTLEFKRTRLAEVIKTLNRHYGTTIVLANDAIGNCRLTAVFEGETVDEVLELLSIQFDLTITRSGANITLNGSGC